MVHRENSNEKKNRETAGKVSLLHGNEESWSMEMTTSRKLLDNAASPVASTSPSLDPAYTVQYLSAATNDEAVRWTTRLAQHFSNLFSRLSAASRNFVSAVWLWRIACFLMLVIIWWKLHVSFGTSSKVFVPGLRLQNSIADFLLHEKDGRIFHLAFRNEQLEKPFVLSGIFRHGTLSRKGNVTSVAHLPTGRARLSEFRLTGDRRFVQLRELPQGLRVEGEMAQAVAAGAWMRPVATLPVVAEGKGEIVVNASSLLSCAFGLLAGDGVSDRVKEDEGTPPADSAIESAGAVALQDTLIRPRNALLAMEFRAKGLGMLVALTSLPDEQMESRAPDRRVGFFIKSSLLFGPDKNESPFELWDQRHRTIQRCNLKAPISYFVDKSVPQRWWEAMREGAEWWNGPLKEAAPSCEGLRVILPSDPDFPTDFVVGDSRYRSISMVASVDTAMALAPSVVDPRSGEILSSNIVFTSAWVSAWLQVLRLLENGLQGDVDHNIQGPLVKTINSLVAGEEAEEELVPDLSAEEFIIRFNKLARERLDHSAPEGDPADSIALLPLLLLDEGGETGEPQVEEVLQELRLAFLNKVMYAGVRAVTAHEVGHTLGLRHNFKASRAVPLENLEMQGRVLSASVMDYLDVNLPVSLLEQQEAGTIDQELVMAAKEDLDSHAKELVQRLADFASDPTRMPMSTSLRAYQMLRLLAHNFFHPGLGPYDYAAIAYGYAEDPVDLEELAVRVNEASELGVDEDDATILGADPAVCIFDAGDGIEWARRELRAVELLQQAVLSKGGSSYILGDALFVQTHRRLIRVCSALTKFVGGLTFSKTPNTPVKQVPREQQVIALSLVLEVIGDGFAAEPACTAEPRRNKWLWGNEALPLVGVKKNGNINVVGAEEADFYKSYLSDVTNGGLLVRQTLLAALAHHSRLSRLALPGAPFTANQLLAAVGQTVVPAVSAVGDPSRVLCPARRDTQFFWVTLLRNSVRQLIETKEDDSGTAVAASALQAELHRLRQQLQTLSVTGDAAGHLDLLMKRCNS